MAIPSAPSGLLSRNVGNECVELSWDSSVGADSYNVYISTSSGGTFTKANLTAITVTKVSLPNIKFGTTVYFKVTAVNVDGESALSSLANDATCSVGSVTLHFQGLVGDKIPVGAMFTSRVNNRLVSFVTTTEGTCA